MNRSISEAGMGISSLGAAGTSIIRMGEKGTAVLLRTFAQELHKIIGSCTQNEQSSQIILEAKNRNPDFWLSGLRQLNIDGILPSSLEAIVSRAKSGSEEILLLEEKTQAIEALADLMDKTEIEVREVMMQANKLEELPSDYFPIRIEDLINLSSHIQSKLSATRQIGDRKLQWPEAVEYVQAILPTEDYEKEKNTIKETVERFHQYQKKGTMLAEDYADLVFMVCSTQTALMIYNTKHGVSIEDGLGLYDACINDPEIGQDIITMMAEIHDIKILERLQIIEQNTRQISQRYNELQEDIKKLLEGFRVESERDFELEREVRGFIGELDDILGVIRYQAAGAKGIVGTHLLIDTDKQVRLLDTARKLTIQSNNDPNLIARILQKLTAFQGGCAKFNRIRGGYLQIAWVAIEYYLEYQNFLPQNLKEDFDGLMSTATHGGIVRPDIELDVASKKAQEIYTLRLIDQQLSGVGRITVEEWIHHIESRPEVEKEKLLSIKLPFPISSFRKNGIMGYSFGKRTFQAPGLNALEKRFKKVDVSMKTGPFFDALKDDGVAPLQFVYLSIDTNTKKYILEPIIENNGNFFRGLSIVPLIQTPNKGGIPFLENIIQIFAQGGENDLYSKKIVNTRANTLGAWNAFNRLQTEAELQGEYQSNKITQAEIPSFYHLQELIRGYTSKAESRLYTSKEEILEDIQGLQTKLQELLELSLGRGILRKKHAPLSRLYQSGNSDKIFRIACNGQWESLNHYQEHLLSLMDAHVANREIISLHYDDIAASSGVGYKKTEIIIHPSETRGQENNETHREGIRTKSYDTYDKLGTILYKLLDIYPKDIFTIHESADGKYAFFEVPSQGKVVFISNLYGYATYVVDGKIDALKNVTNIQQDYRTSFTKISFHPDEAEAWIEEVLRAIEKDTSMQRKTKLLLKAGILDEKGYESEDEWKTFVDKWNTYLEGISQKRQSADSTPENWKAFIEGQEQFLGFEPHEFLLKGRKQTNISLSGFIRAIGGNSYISYYGGVMRRMKEYTSALLKDVDQGTQDARSIEQEIINGNTLKKNVIHFLGKIERGEIRITDDIIAHWHISPENGKLEGMDMVPRNQINIPRGIQTLPSIIIALGGDPNHGVSPARLRKLFESYLEKHGQSIHSTN